MSLFTKTTINGRPAEVSAVFAHTPPRRGLRTAPDTTFGFMVKVGAILERRQGFRTREAADAAREMLLAPERDRDAQDRTISDLMVQHVTATCEPQADGTVVVIADGGEARYVISAAGEQVA